MHSLLQLRCFIFLLQYDFKKAFNSDINDKSRFTVVSHKAKVEAASGAPMDSRLTHMSILQEQEL